MRFETLADGEPADDIEVIAAIETQPLGRLVGGDRSGDRGRLERRFEQLYVVAIRAVMGEPDRDARGLAED